MIHYTVSFSNGSVADLLKILSTRFGDCTVDGQVTINLTGGSTTSLDHLREEVLGFIREGRGKIFAIKHIRSVKGLMLKEAKDLVESWMNQEGISNE